MKTTVGQLQELLEQTTALYNTEKNMILVSEENKKQCARLAGLLAVLDRAPFHPTSDEKLEKSFISQFSLMLRRVAAKHVN